MFPEMRPQATADLVSKALRDVAQDADNVVGSVAGQSPTVVQTSYLHWAEKAEAQLRNVFGPTAIAELLRTDRFWAIRTSTRETPRLIPTILAELQERGDALLTMLAWVEEQQRRWTSPVALLVVPDTNVLLAPGDAWLQIDWQRVAESTIPVRLVVPIVVVHELDRLKRTGNNEARSGAKSALRWLTAHFTFGTLTERVPLPAGSETTVEVFVDDGPTRRTDADGDIIDFTRSLGQMAGVSTRLATHDLGMRLRAAARGVEAAQLPPSD